MKGDFSRYRFDPAKHYTAVLEQQGRVQLDADANEQRAIDWHRLATETVDVIGATGAPIHAAGFAISLRADNRSLLIGPGRYYVDGLLCEAATQADYTQQPWLIDPQPGIDVMLAALRVGRASAVRVWLETWQRLVTPIDDPCIKDPALGEADTTVRLQTVWRVVAEQVAATTTTSLGEIRQAVDTLRTVARATSAGNAIDRPASDHRAGRHARHRGHAERRECGAPRALAGFAAHGGRRRSLGPRARTGRHRRAPRHGTRHDRPHRRRVRAGELLRGHAPQAARAAARNDDGEHATTHPAKGRACPRRRRRIAGSRTSSTASRCIRAGRSRRPRSNGRARTARC